MGTRTKACGRACARCVPPGATAQDFPSRPITFVIPLGAGGVLDVMARVIGAKLSDRLGRARS